MNASFAVSAIDIFERLAEEATSTFAAAVEANKEVDQVGARLRQDERHIKTLEDPKTRRSAEIALAAQRLKYDSLRSVLTECTVARDRAQHKLEIAKMRAWLAIRMVGMSP